MALLYYLAPHRASPGWQWLSVGGALATVGWLIASLALSFYVSSLGSYAKTYGALAGVAVLLLWLYVTSYLMLFGAQINAELERQVAIEGGETGSRPPEPFHDSTGLQRPGRHVASGATSRAPR